MSSATKSIGLFKRGWHEIPEVIGGGFMGLLGVGLTFTALYIYYQKDGDNRRHKLSYTVIRHDDPKVDKVRKDW